jgi:hypothetical protein
MYYYIHRIFSEKSDDPKKYRPISILSCLGKFFTSILNKTIKCLLRRIFVDQRKPSRHRHGYSTNDNIFSLHSLFVLTITLCILQLILFMSNLHHKSSLQTVSKAFSKCIIIYTEYFLFQG